VASVEAIANCWPSPKGAHVIVTSADSTVLPGSADAIVATGGKALQMACIIGEMAQIPRTIETIRANSRKLKYFLD